MVVEVWLVWLMVFHFFSGVVFPIFFLCCCYYVLWLLCFLVSLVLMDVFRLSSISVSSLVWCHFLLSTLGTRERKPIYIMLGYVWHLPQIKQSPFCQEKAAQTDLLSLCWMNTGVEKKMKKTCEKHHVPRPSFHLCPPLPNCQSKLMQGTWGYLVLMRKNFGKTWKVGSSYRVLSDIFQGLDLKLHQLPPPRSQVTQPCYIGICMYEKEWHGVKKSKVNKHV